MPSVKFDPDFLREVPRELWASRRGILKQALCYFSGEPAGQNNLKGFGLGEVDTRVLEQLTMLKSFWTEIFALRRRRRAGTLGS